MTISKLNELENLINFSVCLCKKEIINSKMKTEINNKEVICIKQVIINEIRENTFCIELYFFSFGNEELKYVTIYKDCNIEQLKIFIENTFAKIIDETYKLVEN